MSLIATAGMLGTYLGSPRLPRAYAQAGAPFEAMFAPNAGTGAAFEPLARLRDQIQDRSGRIAATDVHAQTFPFTCSFSVDDSVSLHAAVRSSTDDSIICVTDDIPDLSEQLVIDDTSLVIVGAAGDDSLTSVVLTADDTRHIHATFDDTQGSLALFNMTFAGGDAGASGKGGSIYIDGSVSGSYGTRLSLRDDTFVGNYAGGSGGAVYARDLDGIEMRSLFAGNGVPMIGNRSGGDGGAAYLKDVSDVRIEGGELSTNYAAQRGGALAVYADTDDIEIRMESVTFSDDSAGVSGGAISGWGRNGGILAYSQGIEYQNINAPTVFSGNSAPTGGAVWMSESSANSFMALISVGAVRFTDNSAIAGDGGAVFLYDDGVRSVPFPAPLPVFPNLLSVGYAVDGFGRMSVSYVGNTATGDGGAIHVTGLADTGGLSLLSFYNAYNPFYFTGPEITGNSAGGSGGGVYVDGTMLSWQSSFTGNTADDYGGAIAVDDSLAQPSAFPYPGAFLTTSYFADNSAIAGFPNGGGGAVFVDDSVGTTYVMSSTFTRNAGVIGGAVLSKDDTGVFVNATVTGNTAYIAGGIAMMGAEMTVNFSTVTGNLGLNAAGGLLANRLVISNSIVQGNTSTPVTDAVGLSTLDDSFSLFTSVTTVDSGAGWTPGEGTLFSANPVVGPLGDNGGFRVGDDTVIRTMLPPLGSPVIDAADPNSPGVQILLGNFDERGEGFPRISGGRADMGAVERQVPPVPPTPIPASGPREVKAVAGDREVTVTWQAPSSSGSFPITSYQAVATAEGEQGSSGPSCLVTVPALTCTITGLADGQTYTVRVRALTGAGWGAFSDPSEPFTPQPPQVKSIVITGTREGRQTVVVQGSTTGLVGQRVRAQVRLQGQAAYVAGSTRVVDETGEFTWRRQTRKKTYVYFVAEDAVVRSNRLIIRR